MRITKKKARVTNIVLQNGITRLIYLSIYLSIISALSCGCRFCAFFVAELALQHNHPLFPLSRAISDENVF